MNKTAFILIISLAITSALAVEILSAQCDHSGHDHSKHDQKEETGNSERVPPADAHAGHEHEHEHDEKGSCSDDHESGNIIEISAEQQREYGIKTSVAGPGSLSFSITLNGEVAVNTELQMHHTPRVAGIPENINATTGDYVKKDELLAVIDSAELAEAKSAYYEAFNERALSLIDLKRAGKINENTRRLLDQLRKNPGLTELQKTLPGDMGEHRARLLSSYAEYITGKRTFERRQSLFGDRIISENDFLKAQSDFEKAQAEYLSAQDNTRFEITQKLYDAERKQKVNEFRLRTAERRLFILGLSAEDIEMINRHGAEIQRECNDENCNEQLSKSGRHFHPEDKENFSRINIKAKRYGTIIARNIELGEEIEANRVIFTIADLSSLWALLQAPARDIPLIKKAMQVTISSPDGYETSGRVLMVDPIISGKSRTATIRVAVDNEMGRLRPGNFVTGTVKIAADNLPLVVKRDSVQNLNGGDVVFIPSDNGFRSVEVSIGSEDGENVEILNGLKAGDRYVSEGAFTIKSMMLTGGLDPHAGHGH